MKLFTFLALIGMLAFVNCDAIKCFQTVGDKVEDKLCAGDDAAATKCKGPEFTYAAGITSYAYGCGECDGAEGCEECATASCNVEKVAADDFECANYEWKTDEFVANAAMTTCKSKASMTEHVCNKPGTAADLEADFTAANAGCGPCSVAQEKTDKKCAETSTEVNSAVSMTALLLPLIAAIYALF
ncbi:uncharacterized protein LOC134821936 [Bolinopsis microptera]|uniref:uncharacterized protein LOC134821936 n=1 Tax=Bolinopsis microptera TaxID=2820187 RepID=UPI003079286F